MRVMWKGAVSFGLVNVPVKLYSAVESHDISFRQVHRTDGGRIRLQRVCSACGELVSYDDIAKGYEADDGQVVVLTDDDLAALPNHTSKEVTVEKFVPSEQIDPMLYDKPYYLEPEKVSSKAYALLRDALEGSDRVALVSVAIRSRKTMAVLRVVDGVIVLQTLLWPDEIRASSQLNLGDVGEPSEQEHAMAGLLVESLAGDYDPGELTDDYADAVGALVRSKIEGGGLEAPVAVEAQAEVVDLLEALQRSVDKAKAARGEPVTPTGTAAGSATKAESSTAAGATEPTTTKKNTAKKAAKAARAS